MKESLASLPNFSTGVFKIWQRNFMVFRKSKAESLFWMWLEPLMIFFGVGYGLGAHIKEMQGLSYADFFFPSILCMTSMMVAFFEGSYGNFSKLHLNNTYSAMLTTVLEPEQIVLGEVLWAATKGTTSALGVAIVAGLFGHMDSWNYIFVFMTVFLSAGLFGAIGMYVATRVHSFESIVYPTAGLIVPMSLFSGTYFSLENIPFGMKYLSYVMPLTHTVSLARAFLYNNEPWWIMLLHVLVLSTLCIYFIRISIRRISEELIN